MKLFLHDLNRVRIINDTQEWQGTLAEFLALEPLYPGLPVGMVTRYQTPEFSYVTDGDEMFADAFNALSYCDKISTYPSYTPRGFTAFYVQDPTKTLPFGTGGTLTFPAITGTPNAITVDCATSGHDHDADYADIAHAHAADYAPLTHNHDSDYADIAHAHAADYAPLTHDHDSDYADIAHAHAADYAPLTHDHDADYADIAHAHAADYAPLTHNHDTEYVDIDNATATPTASKIPIADGTGKLAAGWLPSASGVDLFGYDTVIAAYKNATTITIKAGGQYSANGAIHTVISDFDLSISSDLTADDTLTADTWYHVVTNGTTWKLSDAVTCSDVTNGVALRVGVSIYNDSGALKIRQFRDNGLWYQYITSILIYDATMPTTNTTIDLSAYVPASVKCGKFRVGSSKAGDNQTTQLTGAALFVGDIAVCQGEAYRSYSSLSVMWEAVAGVFVATITRSIDFRCAYAYTSGKLWIQEWSK